MADKKANGEDVNLADFGLAAMDISIISPEGEEIEPEAAVQVDMKIKDLPGVENLNDVKETIEIQHHIETEKGVIVESVYDGNLNASFKQDTVENIASKKANKAVDPSSVSADDFEQLNNEEISEIDASFEAEAFSTYTITYYYNYRRKNIHYVDTNGNSLTPTMEPNFDARHQFLIYDIEGYEYDSTHIGSRTGTSISPILRANNNGGLYYSDYIQRFDGYDWFGNEDWESLSNNQDIYVVYKKKNTPSQGGTPTPPQDETWPEGEDAPQFSKSSTNNDNGTNTVSLSIKAAEKPVEKSTPADVIVVFDVSGSMEEDMNRQTRLQRAQSAVNTMATTLLNGANSDVRMALISFSTNATVEQDFTNNYNTFRNKVNRLEAGGGTNWEKALKLANEMNVRSDASTFVVFVTDGDPTFRVSRGNLSDNNLDLQNGYRGYYIASNVFGEGNNDSKGYNFDFAVDQVKSISGANKSFYAIGISNDVSKVQNLTTQGGVDADHAFIASDSTAMENAFKAITESIKSILGFGAVEITDGITDLTSTRMEMLHSVDVNSFKYYRYGGEGNKYGADADHKTEWTTREEDGCGAATYDESSGAVEWHMGDSFQLEDGVTYVVEFIAWPSQEAYDLVADLNNGIKTYDGLTADEKAQVVELETLPVTYALKTNTDEVKATYKKTTESGGTVTISDNHPVDANYTPGKIENMGLQSMKLTIKKEFDDDLTGGEDRETEVTLVLKRRNAHQTPEAAFEDYAVPQGGTTSANIVLNEANGWKYELYVAPGFEVDNEVLEHGYDFTITEPGIDYHYGLLEEIINPMVVNGEEKYYGDGELINGESVEEYTDRALTAVNRVKSGIDITKKVYDTDGTTEIYPDTEFTITGKLLGPNGQPYTWQEGDDVNASGAYHKYDKDGNRIVYKGHFADSSNITFTLKAGERIRFINVPDGCTFEFTESTTDMDSLGYQWVSTKAVTQHRTSAGGEFTPEGDVQPDVSNQTASLNGEKSVVGNKQYAVTYNNKRTIPLPKVELVKIDEITSTKLNDAKFALYADEDRTQPITVDGNGTEISIITGNKESSQGPDGWSNIGLLPAGTYYLYETEAPSGYIKDETPVIITVTKDASAYSVSAKQRDVDVCAYDSTNNVYTITVKNKPTVNTLTVTKKVSGNLGNKSKPFHFTLNVDVDGIRLTKDTWTPEFAEGSVQAADKASDGNWTFELTDAQSLIITNVPSTAIFYVKETEEGQDGYITTYTVNNVEKAGIVGSQLAANGTFPKQEDGSHLDGTVIVENKLDSTVPTGIHTDSTIWRWLIGACFLMFFGSAIYGRRKRRQ